MAKTLKIKLLKYNLSRPVENRISLSEIESKEKIARVRGNNAALLASIHLEIAPKLAKMQEADNFIENRRHENQNFVFDHSGEHYSGSVYQIADSTRQEPNTLAYENDSRFALLTRCQELKEQQTKERLKEDFD